MLLWSGPVLLIIFPCRRWSRVLVTAHWVTTEEGRLCKSQMTSCTEMSWYACYFGQHIYYGLFCFPLAVDRVSLLYVRLWKKSKSYVNHKWNKSTKNVLVHKLVCSGHILLVAFPFRRCSGRLGYCTLGYRWSEGYENLRWNNLLKCIRTHVSLLRSYITSYLCISVVFRRG